jgi:hypothetical protein
MDKSTSITSRFELKNGDFRAREGHWYSPAPAVLSAFLFLSNGKVMLVHVLTERVVQIESLIQLA